MTVTVSCPDCDLDVTATLAGDKREGFCLEDIDGKCAHAIAYDLAPAHLYDAVTAAWYDRLLDHAIDEAEAGAERRR